MSSSRGQRPLAGAYAQSTAASMSPEDERKHGFIAYGLVAGMLVMLAIVYPLTWAFGAPNLFIVLLGLAGGTAAGFAIYRRTRRCPVCRLLDCNPTCRFCGRDRDEEHARYHGKTSLCTCSAERPDIRDGLPGSAAANDDGASGALSGGGFGGMNGLGP
jgi:hypothetical protein